jgi:hypothetical protein
LAFTILTTFALSPVLAGDTLPEGAGKKLVSKNCQACHGLDFLLEKKRSRNEWKKLVDIMVEHGLVISDKDKKTVIDYLAKYLGTSP